MSRSGVIMADHLAWSPASSRMHGITPDQVDYALARRPGQGWNALAKQLGVREPDLRSACEKVLAFGMPKPPTPPRAPAPAEPVEAPPVHCGLKLTPRSRQVFALLAVWDGARHRSEVAKVMGCEKHKASQYLLLLSHHALVKREGGWSVTALGRKELEDQGLIDARGAS